jgi:acetyl-CoA carboxylase carboxyl transferase subunit beta
MNWLKNFVRPKLRELVGGQKEIPDNLWRKCSGCDDMLFHRDLERNLNVCPHCGHHMRLGVKERLELLFDDNEYTPIEVEACVTDPLKFKDRKKYAARLKDAQSKTGEQDALVVAEGKMGGSVVVIAAFNFDFMGGSMGVSVGNGILVAARRAVVCAAPLIVIPSSGGARMQEGILSLMQMARTTIAVSEVRDAGLPYIVVLSDPTTGGVSASFAMLGDIAIAEPGATIGFAGARVIEQTIRETLPEGFQKAESLYQHGMVDMVVHRQDLRTTLIRVIGLLCDKGSLKQETAVVRSDQKTSEDVQILPPDKAEEERDLKDENPSSEKDKDEPPERF